MPDFTLTTASNVARALDGSEMGLISQSGVLSVSASNAVTATTGDNWLTVLGLLNAFNSSSLTGASAVDANGDSFEMAVGRDGYVTAENSILGVIDVDVASQFKLFNQGTIYGDIGGAVTVFHTDGGVDVDIVNSGEMRGDLETIFVRSGTGDTAFENSGSIHGNERTVRFDQDFDSVGSMNIVNSGLVTALDGDAFFFFQGLGFTQFRNSGQIFANRSGVLFNAGGDIHFTNSGLIDGVTSIKMEGGDDSVINTGILIGDVYLGAGNDTIDTQNGVVLGEIQGGPGDDVYHVSDETTDLFEFAGQGTDSVFASGNFHITNISIENLTLQGAGNARGAGNANDNTITGNAGDNALFGFSGNDVLNGLAGDDKMFGGANNDTMNGGDGNDWVHGGGGNDSVFGNDGYDTVEGGSGDDVVRTGDSSGDQGGIGNGGSGNDVVHGNNDDDILNGNSGDDRMVGDAGADKIDGGTGTDTLDYSLSPERVVVNLGANFFSGGHATGDRVSHVENLIGSAGNDVLVGTSGANFLSGLSGLDELRGDGGDDTLRGGADGDILNGGTGADTADYSNSNVRVVINLATGYTDGGHAVGDTLISIERLVGSVFNDRMVGSSSGNRLNGGDGADYLDGGGARDLITGGFANDELIGGAGSDDFIFQTGFGDDTINDFQDGSDIIRFDGITGATQFSDLTITVSGGDLLIEVSGPDSIRLLGANGTVTLTAADFDFT